MVMVVGMAEVGKVKAVAKVKARVLVARVEVGKVRARAEMISLSGALIVKIIPKVATAAKHRLL